MHSMLENKENIHSEYTVSIYSILQYTVEIKLKAGNTGRGFCDCELQRNQCKHCALNHKGVRGTFRVLRLFSVRYVSEN